MTAATAKRVMKEAMALPKAKQRILLGHLWQKLDPIHPQSPTPQEIERRAKSVRNGTAKTYTLEEVEESLDRVKTAVMKRRQKARPSQ